MINKKLTTILLIFSLVFAGFGAPYALENNTTTTQNSSNPNSSISNSTEPVFEEHDDDLVDPINSTYNYSIFSDELKDLPSYYDLRSLGRVTPVKDQGNASTCWIFAALGSLESSLLPYENWNFSENHVKNILSNSYPQGFDRNYTDTGTLWMVLAYLTRYSGPVLASDDPYNITSGISPEGLEPVKHVQETVFIPPRNDSLNNEQLKGAIREYGAVTATMDLSGFYYNNTTYSYYYNGSDKIPNHGICLVGWDDNYSKENFLITPPGDGAFIVRNSWGTDFGDGGYFYISYYDTQLAATGSWAFANVEPATNYNKVYQYDPFGMVDAIPSDSTTTWFSNVFNATSNNGLAAASFYALIPNSTYDLYVYQNPLSGNPTSGTLSLNMSGLISTPGYKTIKFDNYVPLIAGELFSVVVKINTPGINGLIAYEYPMLNYSSKATANLGEGYISEDGVAWEDMATVVANASVCLKAFTVQSTELLLSQEVNNSNPQLGDPVQLIIKLLNNGPDNASSVTVKDQIPEGLKFLSYSSNYGTYDPESGVWTIGDIPVGSLAILTLNCIAQQVGSCTNVVT